MKPEQKQQLDDVFEENGDDFDQAFAICLGNIRHLFNNDQLTADEATEMHQYALAQYNGCSNASKKKESSDGTVS
jgi:hypothetical protein